MTDTLQNDGLLKAARLLTGVFQILLGLLFVGLIVGGPIVLASQNHIADELLATATASVGTIAFAIVGVMLLGAVMVGLGWIFLRLLRQMIDTVGKGDPFIGENAERLHKMGWIAVAIELLKLPTGAIAVFIAHQLKPETFEIDVEFSFTGLLIALVLFILARVFRHGAAMREDLEGTV
ncbi:DUF2975 domain-containing protein [Altererythrobacter sp. Z27]|uniref:DUF2975 domain-containing protein n=1 Tax=Altererythrobacter sp. Z27 TaxID=3461147 RepID=UPI004043BE50